MAQCELHQLDLPENENLKLVRNGFHRNQLSGVKVTGPRVVDQHVEMNGFRECSVEGCLN